MRPILLLTAALLALPLGAQAQPAPPLVRAVKQAVDLPGDAHATTLVEVTVAAGRGGVPRHIHPGVEAAYVIEGTGVLHVDGQPEVILKPGDSFQVPSGVPHSLTNGDVPMRLAVVFVTDKGKPLSAPAPAR